MTGGGGEGPKIELNPKLKKDTDLGQFYGGPQVQSENLNNPVQKNKYQHKNIYFSTKICIPVPKNIFQSKNIYFSTKIYISIQKYLFQYKKSFPKSINISQVSLRPAGRREDGGFEWIFKTKQPLIILRNYKYETIFAFLERFHDIRTSMQTRKIA